jgi:Uma2 family endonuclease
MGAIEVRRWSRQEYDQMVEAGIFPPGDRVELIDGEVLAVTPQGSAHATAVRLAEEALRAAFGAGFDVRVQMPLALDAASEPEPDVAVVRGSPRDYRDHHPATALLVVEVADTTLAHDRERKASLYARAGIAEYWIVNLLDRRLEVYRDPAPRPEARPDSGYREVRSHAASERISPQASPRTAFQVADLLP